MARPNVEMYDYKPNVRSNGNEASAVYFRLTGLDDGESSYELGVAVLHPSGSADQDILRAKSELRLRLQQVVQQLAAEIESGYSDSP